MSSNEQPKGTDSRVEDWFGQSVERDAVLADELTRELPEDEAQRQFEEQATGNAEQAARHGHRIDPDQDRSAYTGDDSDGAPPRPRPTPDSLLWSLGPVRLEARPVPARRSRSDKVPSSQQID